MTVPLLLVVFITIFGQGSVYADKIIYPYGLREGDKTNTITDDGCSPQQRLQQGFSFSGKSYNTLHVCNNGVISFNTKVPKFTPDAPQSTEGKVFVAPFWGEINNTQGKDVYYKETQDPSVLERIKDDMNKHLPNIPYNPSSAFTATWEVLGNYGSSSQKSKTFQAVLSIDGETSFIILNYDSTKRPDVDDDTPEQAGLNSGYHTHYFSPPEPKTNKVVEITATSNVNEPGQWIIQTDEFKVPGGCIFDAKFAKEGKPFWKESNCSTKCLCQDYNVNCVPEACPPSSTCKVLGSFFTCNKKPK